MPTNLHTMAHHNFRVLEREVSAGDGRVIVSFAGEHEVHFIEDGKVLVFGREPLFANGTTIAYEVFAPSLWHWEPPSQAESIPEDRREEILAGIRAGLAALGTRAVFPGEPL